MRRYSLVSARTQSAVKRISAFRISPERGSTSEGPIAKTDETEGIQRIVEYRASAGFFAEVLLGDFEIEGAVLLEIEIEEPGEGLHLRDERFDGAFGRGFLGDQGIVHRHRRQGQHKPEYKNFASTHIAPPFPPHPFSPLSLRGERGRG
jgi:hypothetical protein